MVKDVILSLLLLFSKVVIVYNCSIGNYLRDGSCTSCEKGFYCPRENMTVPFPCPLGEYTNNSGSLQCELCHAGFYCNRTDTEPIKCKHGFYSTEKMSICMPCPAGFRWG